MIGEYVRIDPIDLLNDVPLLWDAFNGNTSDRNDSNNNNNSGDVIDEYLKWILKYFRMESFGGIDGFKSFLTDIEKNPLHSVVVFRLINNNDEGTGVDNMVVGFADYIYSRPDHGVMEIGIAHGHAMAQTRASTEVHYLLAKYVFEHLQYRRYEWKCDSLNIKSNNTAQRLGFRFEGC
jgi:RimJ/RimL family protein N-acetyltransferase